MSYADWQVQTGGVLLGAGTAYQLTALDHAKPDTTAGDQPLPGEDGLMFGRDTLTGTTVTIEANVIVPGNAGGVLDALATWRSAWQADAVRAAPGAVTTLDVQLPGRETRTVFGRPRQFTPASLSNAISGLIPVTCDWQCADHRFYGPEQVVTLSTAPDVTGGITWPVTWPLSWAGSTATGGRVLNSGDSATWPVVTFYGPVSMPGIAWGDVSLTVVTVLTQGQSVTLDTRPWVRTALRETGGSVAGLLRGDRLGALSLPPGLTSIQYTGTDNTATSSCEIRWRSASSSL